VALAALAWPVGVTAAPVAAPEPKIVLAFFMDGTVLRGGRPVDEARLRADLAALKKGDDILLCLQGMNDNVSDAFDRYVLRNRGEYDARIQTQGRCPPDPATEGRPAGR
jgi:hypothetical protein